MQQLRLLILIWGQFPKAFVLHHKHLMTRPKKAAVIDFVDFLLSDEIFSALGKTATMPAKNITLDASELDVYKRQQ